MTATTETIETIDVDSATATPLPTADPASVGFARERLDRLDDAMQAEIDAGHYAGISLMIARHGKLVKSGRYGYQTLESRDPMRKDASAWRRRTATASHADTPSTNT